jgi:AcrR family transcriptional regulator
MAEEEPDRVGRTAWGSISRDQIVGTTVAMLRTRSFDQITIRALAHEMGVAPMSLYRHVRDKNDLLDEAVDRMLSRQWRPRSDRSDWKAWIGECADRLRRFLVEQPAALQVYLDHPVVARHAVARMQAMMEVLRTRLGSDDAAQRAYGAVQTYTIGFAALETSRAGWAPAEGEVDPIALRLAAYATPAQFSVGLRYLLTGIEAEIRE